MLPVPKDVPDDHPKFDFANFKKESLLKARTHVYNNGVIRTMVMKEIAMAYNTGRITLEQFCEQDYRFKNGLPFIVM